MIKWCRASLQYSGFGEALFSGVFRIDHDNWSFVQSVGLYDTCRQVSTMNHNLVGNKIVDYSDIVGAVGASSVGAAPAISSFST